MTKMYVQKRPCSYVCITSYSDVAHLRLHGMQMAIYPSDEEEKLRRKQRQEEDEADAELIVQFQAAPHQQ